MMRLHHIGIFVNDLDAVEEFFIKLFPGAESYEPYANLRTGFTSWKLLLPDGSRLELMHKENLASIVPDASFGLAHLSFAVGTEAAVDEMVTRLGNLGAKVVDGPRLTGDGYYELKAFGPENIVLEFCARD